MSPTCRPVWVDSTAGQRLFLDHIPATTSQLNCSSRQVVARVYCFLRFCIKPMRYIYHPQLDCYLVTVNRDCSRSCELTLRLCPENDEKKNLVHIKGYISIIDIKYNSWSEVLIFAKDSCREIITLLNNLRMSFVLKTISQNKWMNYQWLREHIHSETSH